MLSFVKLRRLPHDQLPPVSGDIRLYAIIGTPCQIQGYVFTRDNGLPLNPDSITDWLNKFSRDKGLPHIHPHAFRHTAASMMISEGVDLVTTAHELGHANASTTATIYAHQIEEAQAKATEARASVFSRRKQA